MNEKEKLIKALHDIFYLQANDIALIVNNCAVSNIALFLNKTNNITARISINNCVTPVRMYPGATKQLDQQQQLLVYYLIKRTHIVTVTEQNLANILNISQSTISNYVTAISRSLTDNDKLSIVLY